MSVKIADLAKKLGITAVQLRKKINASGFEIKSRATTIDDDIVKFIEDEFGEKRTVVAQTEASLPISAEKEKSGNKSGVEKAFDNVKTPGNVEKASGDTTEVYAEIYDKALDREIIKAQRKMTAGKDLRPKKPVREIRAPTTVAAPMQVGDVIEIPEVIPVKEFAEKTGIPVAKVIGELMKNGILANINQQIDFETAQIIADDMKIAIRKRRTAASISEMMEGNLDVLLKEDDKSVLKPRPPIVVVMGHVDHGKTKLLDRIRKTHVAEGEAGGITQKIGAYQIELKDRKITFLDTPGHEAFTAMRARGAKVTDIAILVVAADEGIKPQTIEAIHHAKEAGVPIIVALNKIDKPAANVDKVKGELTEYELVSEEWGGKTIMVPVSAITGEGVDTLLEMILLTADIINLRANPDRKAVGTVIEAHLDKSLGPVATVIVNTGTLRIGGNVVAGPVHGKVKAMKDFSGKNIKEAGPSTPVFIAGLTKTPHAGDVLHVVADERTARENASKIKNIQAFEAAKGGLSNIINQIQSGNLKVLKIVLKADTKGSLDALRESLAKIHHEEVALKVIHSGVGNITESDVTMASASNGIVIGFNTLVSQHVKNIAERYGVEIATYNIIYKLLEDIHGILSGMLEPEIIETVLGQMQVLQIFYHKKQNMIVGCRVTSGIVRNKAHLRVMRGGAVIGAGEIQSLKKVNETANELNEGNECGVKYFGEVELAEGDTLEAYITERRKKELKTI